MIRVLKNKTPGFLHIYKSISRLQKTRQDLHNSAHKKEKKRGKTDLIEKIVIVTGSLIVHNTSIDSCKKHPQTANVAESVVPSKG